MSVRKIMYGKIVNFHRVEAGQDQKLTIDEVKNWAKKLNKESKYDSEVAAEELGAHSGDVVSKEGAFRIPTYLN